MADRKLKLGRIFLLLMAVLLVGSVVFGDGDFGGKDRYQTALILALICVFISGAPLFTIMLSATALGTLYSTRGFEIGFDGAINKLFGTSGRDEMEVLSTIPLFIYAGYLLAEAKTADRLVRFANAFVGWIPGGLAIVTISTCALFTVFTGGSGVTIIALGGVLMPALVKNGYPERFSLGLIAGTGSVGLLLPPALPLFIYGTVYGLVQSEEEKAAGVWATERFLFAGIVPGMFLIGLLFLIAIFIAVKKKLPRQKFVLGELGRSFVAAFPELMLPFGVVGALAVGFGLPEVAALTVAYVLLIEAVLYTPLTAGVMNTLVSTIARRKVKVGWPISTINAKAMWSISFEAMAMIGAIFMIILASTALTDFTVNADVPKKMVEWTTAHVSSKIMFLLAINVILLIVGTVMDIFSAIVVVVPLIAPISRQYGIDPYHLGIIFLLNLEVGYLHPPVGLNLFLTSVKFQRPITEVMWATVPFLLTMIFALLVITYVPALTAVSVPPAKRTDPVANLVAIVENGIEESKVVMKTITLVDAAGNKLVGADGKPLERKLSACRKPRTDSEGKTRPPTDAEIATCQKLFFDVTDCSADAKSTDPKVVTCRNQAIAKWAADRFIDNPSEAVFLVKEVTLVDDAGDPLTVEEEVTGPDGKPKLDELGIPEKKNVPILDNGKPVTRTLAWCDKLEFHSDTEKCKGLFVAASNCRISFEDPEDDCLDDKCPAKEDDEGGDEAGSGSGSGSGSAEAGSGSGSGAGAGSGAPVDQAACRKEAAKACRESQIVKCIGEAAKNWVDDNPILAKNPKLK